MRYLLLSAGWTAVALAVVGIFLPIMPTVPFLLIAAFCFARSSHKIHEWLISHPTFGPPINDWRARGVIRRRAKIAAILSMAGGFIVVVVLGLSPLILTVQGIVLLAVALFIWTRPEA